MAPESTEGITPPRNFIVILRMRTGYRCRCGIHSIGEITDFGGVRAA